MTIGIYCLNFNDNVYIGKSNNIERRYKDHIEAFKNNKGSTKTQEAYNLYGVPELLVLEECEIKDLGNKETFWIKEFNSYATGLNMSNGGDGGGSGVQHNRAIHSKELLLEVLEYLLDDIVLTYQEIFELTGVSVSTLTNIVEGYSHAWIREEYDDKFSIISSNEFKNKRNLRSKSLKAIKMLGTKGLNVYPTIISPEGIEYSNITNAKDFAKENNLTREGLSRLFSGKIKQHRNWKLK